MPAVRGMEGVHATSSVSQSLTGLIHITIPALTVYIADGHKPNCSGRSYPPTIVCHKELVLSQLGLFDQPFSFFFLDLLKLTISDLQFWPMKFRQ